jgi:hypothetical protein
MKSPYTLGFIKPGQTDELPLIYGISAVISPITGQFISGAPEFATEENLAARTTGPGEKIYQDPKTRLYYWKNKDGKRVTCANCFDLSNAVIQD